MRLLAVFVLAGALGGCSTWVPVHSAREAEGRRVKVEIAGKETDIDQAVTCDGDGWVLAAQVSDCDDPGKSFDARRAKVVAEEENTKRSSVGYVVAAVLAAIFVPAGIVGTAVLGIH